MSSIRIFVADDHPVIAELLPSALHSFGIESVGSALVPADVIPQYERTKPDVVIMDVWWSNGGGADAGLAMTADLIARDPDAKVICYSQFDQVETISEAYRLGCRAYVTKQISFSDLADVIRRVCEGQLYFLPTIAERLAVIHVKGNSSPRALLDPRELEIFKLLARGMSISDIAKAINLGHKTVSVIAPQIKKKLGVHTPAELTLMAVKYGLIDIA